MEEETMQKAIKDLIAAIHICDSKEKEKSGAKKTIKFLDH
tara:strand:- start:93 stop:212 length:120 start_codon:yes stop_codon:yes gene_type:complete